VAETHDLPDFDDEIADLQQELLALLPEHVRDLRSALALAITDQGARAAVQRLGHRLGGTAATVGLGAVGDLGRAIERFSRARTQWTSQDVARVTAAVDALDAWSREVLRSGRLDLEGLVSDARVKALSEAP
jgi:HPt (histidine-containing phosphotransfer) domain-containing protein